VDITVQDDNHAEAVCIRYCVVIR